MSVRRSGRLDKPKRTISPDRPICCQHTGYSDELSLKRLKKRELAIKDEIAQLKMAMMPDMPA